MSYQVSPASLPRLVPIRRLGLCASLVGVCRPMQRRADLQLVLTAALDTHHTAPALAKELPLSTQEPALDRALPRAHHDVAHPPPVPPIRSSNLQGGGGYAGGGYSRNGDGGNGNGVTQVCSAVRRMLQDHFLHLCFSYFGHAAMWPADRDAFLCGYFTRSDLHGGGGSPLGPSPLCFDGRSLLVGLRGTCALLTEAPRRGVACHRIFHRSHTPRA